MWCSSIAVIALVSLVLRELGSVMLVLLLWPWLLKGSWGLVSKLLLAAVFKLGERYLWHVLPQL